MKKLLQIVMVFSLLFFLFIGCSNPLMENNSNKNGNTETNQTSGTVDVLPEETEGEVAFPGKKGEVLTANAMINGSIREITYERIEGKNVFEGDIIIPDEDINAELSRAVVRTNKTWPYGRVNFSIRSDVFSETIIRQAIQHIEANSIITFNEAASGNYIEFIPDTGSWSYIGMIGGRQQVALANWASVGTAIHEICHALGVEHEHTRADRDSHIIIHWNNIESGRGHNFQINNSSSHRDISTFNFNSIMMYSSFGFSNNGQATITRLDGSTFGAQRRNLVQTDIDGLNYLYGNSHEYQGLQIGTYGYTAGGWRVNQHPRFMADVNGDGRDDVVGFANAGVYVSLARSNGTFSSPILGVRSFGYSAGGWRTEMHPRMMADVNGDGKADVVGFANAGVYVSLSNGNGTFKSPIRGVASFGYDAGGWRVDRHPRMMADVNGDGRDDVVGFANAGVYISLSNGNGTFQNPRHVIGTFGYSAGGWRVNMHPRMMADVNGDGRADVVGFANAGVYVSLSNGNGTFQSPRLGVSSYGYNAGGWRIEKHPRMMADINGDNRADIVGFANAGVYVSLSNGNGTFQSPRKVISTFGYDAGGWRVNMHPRMMSDVNGDGYDDVVGFANAGVYVSLSRGNGTFGGAQKAINGFGYNAGGWRVDKHPRFVADIDGDHKMDIVGFASSGVVTAINSN